MNSPIEKENIDLKNENGQKLDQMALNPNNFRANNDNSLNFNNDGNNLNQSDSRSSLLQRTPSGNIISENSNIEILKQIEKKSQDKLNQIKIDLIDLGFSEDNVQEALQQTNFCPELAFDIIYEKEKKNNEKDISIKYNYTEIYTNYEEKDQRYIESIVKNYGLTLDDAVEAFESCNRNVSTTEQLIELLK